MNLFIDAKREGYEPGQVDETMTLGELVELLSALEYEHGEDTKVYLSHDNGYTYGGITEESINIGEE